VTARAGRHSKASKPAGEREAFDTMSKSKNIVANILLLLLSLFTSLISLEILARALFVEHPPLVVASNDFHLIYELNPHYPEINSFGMRQEEFDPSTLRHQFVIAVIGDSHSFSAQSAEWENSFPARLEHHLSALSEKSIKVLNFGVRLQYGTRIRSSES
jgi:hypothetical protein